jgi:radical SAM protein with 4Fe4S-binding SPASM domain
MNDRNIIPDLTWVDEFIENVKPYIFVRLEDNLLIKRPNNAQKLNDTGALILKSLLDGMPISKVLDKIGREQSKIIDTANFLYAIRHQLEGNLDEFTLNPAVEVKPFEMKFTDYPVLSEVALTYRCNLRCKFCYAGCGCTTNPAHSSNEMSIAEVKKILWKLFHQAKVPSVSFTGGEPTLVSELPLFVKYAKEFGMRVNLITNGTTITETLVKELAACGLDSAQVSIEGVTADTHDNMVGRKGAFEKSVKAITLLNDQGILTHSNTTITRDNLQECLMMPQFVKEKLGVDRFSMNLMIPTGSGAINEELVVYYKDAGNYLNKIIRESEKQDVEFMWYSPVPMCMFNSIVHGLGNKGCSACDGLISVAANGDVLPCASFDESVGNLLQNDFKAIWNSEKAVHYRDKQMAHELCKGCEDFHICNGGCPLYWRQIGYAELAEVGDSSSGCVIQVSK